MDPDLKKRGVSQWLFQKKSAPYQKNRQNPGNRECHIKGGESVEFLEDSEDPDDPQHTDSHDCKDRRQRGMPGSPQNAGGNFIKTADGLDEKDGHDPHSGYLNDLRIRSKQHGKTVLPDDNGKGKYTCEQKGKDEALFQDLFTSFLVSGSKILTGKSGGCLAKGSHDIVGEIFKIHCNGTSGSCICSKTVYGSLHENICKTEHCTLYSSRNSDHKDLAQLCPVKLQFRKGQMKFV